MDSSSKAPPKDLSHHFSYVTRNRKPSNIKQFYKYFMIPGIGNLAGGLPNNNYFPFDTLEGAAALPNRFKPTPNDPVDPPADSASGSVDPTGSQVVVPKVSGTRDLLREIDLKTALQYGTAQGYPPLYTFIRQFARENLHPNVPYAGGPEVILTCGSTDGMSKSVECLTNPWIEGRDPISERQGLLCEEFAYGNALQAVRPRGLSIVPVAIDDEGMIAEGKGSLEDVLANWDFKKGKRPHLMYTVTMGQNPTGSLLSVKRRRELYALCSKYDVIIIEDDPYWYLQYPSANQLSMSARGKPTSTEARPGECNYNAPISSGFPFLDSLVPSYLSVDTDGRVIRLDTFSKTVAPGCRLGWITTQPALVDKLLRITETSTQQPSGFVQSLIAQLIMGPEGPVPGTNGGGKKQKQEGWKVDGWVRWLEGLRGNYERRMQTMCGILEAGRYQLKTGRRPSLDGIAMAAVGPAGDEDADGWRVVDKTALYTFDWPLGGMFVWVKMLLGSHPLFRKVGHEKLSRALWVFLTTKPYLVLVAPGTMFSATEAIAQDRGWAFFRMCFAAVDEQDVERMSHRFVEAVRAFWRKKEVDDIDELLAGLEGVVLVDEEDENENEGGMGMGMGMMMPAVGL